MSLLWSSFLHFTISTMFVLLWPLCLSLQLEKLLKVLSGVGAHVSPTPRLCLTMFTKVSTPKFPEQWAVISFQLWDRLNSPSSKAITIAPTAVAHLVGHHPTKWKVASSIPGQGKCLGCGFSPQSGHIREAANKCFSYISVSLALFLPPFPRPSLSKRKKKQFWLCFAQKCLMKTEPSVLHLSPC